MNGPTGPHPPPVTTCRPNDRFYQVLSPLLHHHQARRSGDTVLNALPPRSEWPDSVLLAAYHQLKGEAPHTLVANAIAADATGPADWCMRERNYARSTGAAAALCFAIGLGDRHLSNILYDHNTSEIVHIDYNVCFDKGWSLAVPETVPFRLTANLVRAFGPFGTSNGAFRCALVHALRVSRERSALLTETLAGCFESDPLPGIASEIMLNAVGEKLRGNAPHPWHSDATALAEGNDEARAAWLVRLATDERRLAFMFEGWSAWL